MPNRKNEDSYYLSAMKFCREKREEMGLTQDNVATGMDVSSDTYSRWERGKPLPNDGQLNRLLKIVKSNRQEMEAYIVQQNSTFAQTLNNPVVPPPKDPVTDPASPKSPQTMAESAASNAPHPVPVVNPNLPRRQALPHIVSVLVLMIMGAIVTTWILAAPALRRDNPHANAQVIDQSLEVKGELQLRLEAINVIFTGPDSTAAHRKEFFNDLLTDPTLESFANTLISVSNGRRFKRSVHLDTVFGLYKQLYSNDPKVQKNPDSLHPQPEEVKNKKIIKRACLKFWNQYYWKINPVPTFDQMF